MPLQNSDKVILYLSSQMTGLQDFNYKAFHDLEIKLKKKYPKIKILNPIATFNGSRTRTRKEYMRKDFEMLLKATSVMFFGTWKESKGAMAEYTVAKELELDLWDENGEELEVLEDKEPKDILDEARNLVLGDRKRDYDSPMRNFQKIANLWSALGFQWKGGPVPMERVADAMILLKLARGAHTYKLDSEIDGVGYYFCKQMALKEQEELGKTENYYIEKYQKFVQIVTET